MPSESDFQLEAKKIAIEDAKLLVEKEKLRLEERKEVEHSKVRWTAVAVIVSVLTAGLTVGLGSWSVWRTGRDQFAAKLAEITFASDNPDVGAGKAAALAYLFGDRLPEPLKGRLADNKELRKQIFLHSGGIDGSKLTIPPPDMQLDILKMVLASAPSDRELIVRTWRSAFPQYSPWIDNFAKDIALPSVTP